MRCIAIGAAATAALLTTAAWGQGPPERKEDRRERAAPQQRAAPERMQPPSGQTREQSPRVEMREPRGFRGEGPSQKEGAPRLERKEDRRVGRTLEREPSSPKQRDRGDRIERREQQERVERRREPKQVERREPKQIERREQGERRAYRPDERIDQRSVQGRERPETRAGRAERGDGQLRQRDDARVARSRLTQEQQVRLRESFDRSRARVTNVKFAARIGTHIPRRVRLYAVPAAVLAIVPAYSAYRYVYYEDNICIIDPATYEIVDVIEYRAAPGGPQIAVLELSAAERAIVLDSIGPDFPSANVSIRLALGAEIPGRAALHQFPDIVLDRVPKLRGYRFLVANDDVVIVDPREREIALILRR